MLVRPSLRVGPTPCSVRVVFPAFCVVIQFSRLPRLEFCYIVCSVFCQISLSWSTVQPAIHNQPTSFPSNIRGNHPAMFVRLLSLASGSMVAISVGIRPVSLPVDAAVFAFFLLVCVLCGVAPSALANAIRFIERSTIDTETFTQICVPVSNAF